MTEKNFATDSPHRILPEWLREGWGIVGILSAVYGILFFVWTILHWGGEGNVVLISDLAALPIDLLAALIAWRVFLNSKLDHRIRKAWLILGIAMLSYFIGDVIWSYLENVLKVEPFPAISDAFYLALYPLVLWGLSLLSRAPLSQRERLTFWLDLLTTAVVATMALAYFIVIPTAQANASDALTQITLIAYPLGDLMIFVGLVAALLRRPEHDSRSALFFFFIGMVLFLSADLGFDYTGLSGTFSSGSLIDAGWVGAHVFFILAAVRQMYRSGVSADNTRLAWMLDGLTQVLAYVAVSVSYVLAVDAILTDFGPAAWWLLAGAIISTILFIIRQLHQVRVQIRLTAFMLVTTVPLLVGVTALVSSRATSVMEEQANTDLRQNDEFLSANVATWLELHVRTLQEMAILPDIVSMDPVKQRPILLAVASTHPNLFLVHTLDLNGINVARNDDSEPKDYHDRTWFLDAKSGAPISYQVVISRTTGKPALSLAVPIRNSSGQIIGVASIVSELNEISKEMLFVNEGSNSSYIVDATNKVVAHPDPSLTSGDQLADLSAAPPIEALRKGQAGLIVFTDENGIRWRAYVNSLDNGWGIVSQQPEADVLAAARSFQRIAIGLIMVTAVAMLILAWFTIRGALQPVAALTDAATAIAAGELNRTVEVKNQDELGMLASAFNSMTAQLRDLISGLEQRVADRTKALLTSAEVSRRLSTILNERQLILEVVEQLRVSFNYYHVHIYLLDEASGDLIMTGGTGDVGASLLGSGHKVSKGQGLVGRAAKTNATILVQDVSHDLNWLPNPLLTETKAEIAVPISIGSQMFGVLDVQHDVVNGLTQEDVHLLQSIANQVAVALLNARSYTDLQQRAELESKITSVGQKIQSTTTVEGALQVAAQELGRILGSKDTRVILETTHWTADNDYRSTKLK